MWLIVLLIGVFWLMTVAAVLVDRSQRPDCYGSGPSALDQYYNDCESCDYCGECMG